MKPVQRRYVTVDGVSLAYEEYGHGDPIVFIHGFPASSYSWRYISQALSRSHRTVCPDMMGFGYSAKPADEDYSIPRQAELMLGAVKQLGLERFVLAGHSLGGGVCLEMLRRLGPDQGMVSRVALVDCVCYPQRLPWFIHALKMPWLPGILMSIIPERWGFQILAPWMYHPRNGMHPDAIREYAERLHARGGHKAIISVAKHIIPHNTDEMVCSYSRIQIPALIIWGEQDRVLPRRLGERLAEDIRHSEFHLMNNCGHCPQEEKPEETLGLIRRFVG